MFDAQRLLGSLLSDVAGNATGRSLGGLLGGRQRGSSSWKLQAGLGLAGLAMAAWEHFQEQGSSGAGGRPPPPAPVPGRPGAPSAAPPPPPPPPAGGAPAAAGVVPPPPAADDMQARAVLGLRAMVSAAVADGHLDEAERGRILERADQAGAGEAARRFLEAELASPATVEALAGAVTGRAQAEEVYALSLLAVDVDTAAELDHLRRLAEALGLDAARVQQITDAVGRARGG